MKFDQTLRRHLRRAPTDKPIPLEADLVSIGLDSIGALGLLLDIEATFNVSVPGALLTLETFRTRATLESVVATLVEGE